MCLTTWLIEGKVCRMYECSPSQVSRCRWKSLYAGANLEEESPYRHHPSHCLHTLAVSSLHKPFLHQTETAPSLHSLQVLTLAFLQSSADSRSCAHLECVLELLHRCGIV